MGARMFVAVRPSADVLATLDALIEPRREAGGDLRWIRPDQAHITLAFMADVPLVRVELMEENLEAVAQRTSPFQIVIDGAGCFPHPTAAKALVLAVAVGGDPLSALARGARTAIERAGVQTDNKRFVPHLTMARARRPMEATRWLRILDSFPPLSWQAADMVLVESHLHASSAEHRLVAEYPFGGPALPMSGV